MTPKSKKKLPLGFVGKAILIANMLSVMLLLLSYLAPTIDPVIFWPIAFVGLAYPFLLLANVLFAVYWLFVRPKIALVSILVIIAGWKFVSGQIGFRGSGTSEMPKSSANFIRVMTYNVHYFKKVDSANNKLIKDQMLDIIRQEQPDIVCFQEFMSHASGEFNMEKSIKEILHSNYFYFLPYNKWDYERIGLAIFSKFPILDQGHILFSDKVRGNEAIYTDIEFKNKPFRIYNVHFQSIAFQPSDYKYLKNVEEINPDVQASRRIGNRLKSAFIKRSQQVKFLKNHVQDCTFPFVIAGDFNDTPISYALNTMSQGLKNAFIEKGTGFGNTYNGDFPNFQIDYILTTPDFDIKNYRIIEKKLSDHYAIRSDIELRH
jgi:endonuclease/exonuclease/phosphatase family metal-dependent hydrolase